MTDEFGNETSNRSKVIVAIVAAVILVAVVILGVVIMRRRSQGNVNVPLVNTPSGNVNGGAVNTPVTTTPDGEPISDGRTVTHTSGIIYDAPAGVEYGKEFTATDEEKRAWGYPTDVRVTYLWTQPTETSGSVRVITNPIDKPGEPDADGDGLADKDEPTYKTDKNNRDTDGDGLLDGTEVHETKTDPTKADTNGDGVPDTYPAKAKPQP